MSLPWLSLLLLTSAAAAHAADTDDNIHLTPGPRATPELAAELLEMDRKLFAAAFNGCDPDALAPLVADDFEFFHDKWGKNSNSGAEFVASVRAMCARRKTGEDFTARRELDPGSVSVHVIGDYGAMQMGTHRFYAIVAGKPDRLTEVSKFIDLWQRDAAGAWKLARVISYDHVLAAPAAP
jgi:ketosteroid isomerase-like protein